MAQVGKFIGIGLNYADHAAEPGMTVPPEPVVFNTWTSAICGLGAISGQYKYQGNLLSAVFTWADLQQKTALTFHCIE